MQDYVQSWEFQAWVWGGGGCASTADPAGTLETGDFAYLL